MSGRFGVTHDIYMDGYLYRSLVSPDLPKDIIMKEVIAQKITTEANRNIQDFHDNTPRLFTSWHQGAGQKFYGIADPYNAYAYNESEKINIDFLGELRLAPLFDQDTAVNITGAVGYNMPVHRAYKYLTYGYYDDDTNKYKIALYPQQNGTPVIADGPNTGGYTVYAVAYCAPAGGTQYLFAGTSNGLYRAGIDNVWSAAAQTSANVYTKLAEYANNLYGIRVSGAVYYLDKIDTASPGNVTNIKTTSDEALLYVLKHNNNIYVIGDSNIYKLNAAGTALEYYCKLPEAFYAESAFSYLNTLYLCGSEQRDFSYPAVYYITQDDEGPSLLFDRNIESTHIAKYNQGFGIFDKLYFIEKHTTALSITYYYVVEYNLTTGGHSIIHKHGSSTDVASKEPICIHNHDEDIWLIASDGKYLADFDAQLAASGFLTTGIDYYNMPTQDKLFTRVELVCEPLKTSEEIVVYKRGDAQIIQQYIETTQEDFQQGTLNGVEALTEGDLSLSLNEPGAIIPSADASMDYNNPTSNINTAYIPVGRSATPYKYRSLIRINTDDALGDNLLVSATLRLYQPSSGYGSGYYYDVIRLTQTAWTETGVTWNTYDGTNPWSNAGGDYNETDKASTIIGSATGWKTWDVTALVSYAQANTSGICNWIIKLQTEGDLSLHTFESRSGTNPPQLILTFRTATGTRTKIVDISTGETVEESDITFNSTLNGQTLAVKTAISTDGGLNYTTLTAVTSGDSVPTLSESTNLTNARLKIEETLSTTNIAQLPQLDDLTVTLSKSVEFSAAQKAGTSTLNRVLNLTTLGQTNESADVLYEGKGIEFLIVVKLGTDLNHSPRVNSLGYYFVPAQDFKKTFKVPIAVTDYPTMLDGKPDPKTGSTLLSQLKTSLAKTYFELKDCGWSASDTFNVRCVTQQYREFMLDVNSPIQKILYLELKEV